VAIIGAALPDSRPAGHADPWTSCDTPAPPSPAAANGDCRVTAGKRFAYPRSGRGSRP